MSGLFGTNVSRLEHKSVEWYTPPWIFEALGLQFDLDPAHPHDMACAVPCKAHYTVFDDGLKQPWHGRVWLNPPYGLLTPFWMARMVDHGNGIALCFSRTDATWCQEAMRAAHATLFLSGRVDFLPGRENQHKTSRSGAGTVMFAFGAENALALAALAPKGIFFRQPQP